MGFEPVTPPGKDMRLSAVASIGKARAKGVQLSWQIRISGLVGVGRFELPTSWSQTRRSNLAELHPGFSSS